MPFLTTPENVLSAPSRQLVWCQVSVFLVIPLFDKLCMRHAKWTRKTLKSIALLAACTPSCPCIDSSLPNMPLFALPRHFLGHACRYCVRGQRSILFVIPLSGKLWVRCT